MTAAHRAGGAHGTMLMQAIASAFVTGADRAVLADVIATLAGVLIAFRTLRPARPTAAAAAAPGGAARG